MSRVRLPKVQEPGRGKGASAEASSSRLREPGPGRGENIPRTVTSSEVERCRGFIRKCVRVEVMTSCHDFIFI